jgi:hypothetical protein
MSQKEKELIEEKKRELDEELTDALVDEPSGIGENKVQTSVSTTTSQKITEVQQFKHDIFIRAVGYSTIAISVGASMDSTAAIIVGLAPLLWYTNRFYNVKGERPADKRYTIHESEK